MCSLGALEPSLRAFLAAQDQRYPPIFVTGVGLAVVLQRITTFPLRGEPRNAIVQALCDALAALASSSAALESP